MSKAIKWILILLLIVILSSCTKKYYCYSEDGERVILKVITLTGALLDGIPIKVQNLNKICDIAREELDDQSN